MAIRAKFKVSSVEHFEGPAEKVNLMAVNGRDGKGNEQWAKWTPSGTLSLTINNPDAQGKLEVGKMYYLDVTEAPPEE